MGVLRARLLRRLRAADRHDRLRVYHPRLPGVEDRDFTLHSKVAVIDDRLLRIGSANLANRSMGLDTECDLAIESHRNDRSVAEAIAGFRSRLLAEHLGCDSEDVERVVSREDPLIRAVETLCGGERSLEPLEGEVAEWIDGLVPEAAVIDPERPTRLRDLTRISTRIRSADGASGCASCSRPHWSWGSQQFGPARLCGSGPSRSDWARSSAACAAAPGDRSSLLPPSQRPASRSSPSPRSPWRQRSSSAGPWASRSRWSGRQSAPAPATWSGRRSGGIRSDGSRAAAWMG